MLCPTNAADASVQYLRGGSRELDLRQPVVMGVLNLTPDSFSDGGAYQLHSSRDRLDIGAAMARVDQMIDEGAKIIDVGGESSRPGATPVPLADELARVMPVIERLAEVDTMVSVDTYKAEVAAAAIAAGVHLVNDITGARHEKLLSTVAASDAALCVMHMQGAPQSMQRAPQYGDVCQEVGDYLVSRLAAAQASGIATDRLLADPGFGFGKSVAHNLALLRGLPSLVARLEQDNLVAAVLVGLSRKSMLAAITQRAVDERLAGSVAAATLAAAAGAKIVRAHDVAATVDAMAVVEAVRRGDTSAG